MMTERFHRVGMRLLAASIFSGLGGGLSISHAEPVILLKPTVTWNITGKDDVRQLKRLASGVGWDFEPNAETTAGLNKLGIKTIRCINIEPVPGHFNKEGDFIVDRSGGRTDRLLSHLGTCREIGANPHLIIGGMPPELLLTSEDVPESQRGIFGNATANQDYGPKDWGKFQKYCEAFFEYILIDQKFHEARFEVGNEPEFSAFPYPRPPKPAAGSREKYEAYFNLYKNVALAAGQFEKDHPGLHVTLGGMGAGWAYTFKFGAFNWPERFLRDCGTLKIRLDFLGLHWYGNGSSINGEYPANYPSFTEMLQHTKAARDRYCPGVPIWFTEWGPSYVVSDEPDAMINANHIGAAWTAMAFNELLEFGVDGVLYLCTTDGRQQAKDGKWENVWGWCSLFTNPNVLGKPHRKMPYHVFDMIHRLEGTRVESTRAGANINSFASADKDKKRVTVMVWNYACRIPERGLPVDNSSREAAILRVREAAAFFGTPKIHVKRWLASESVSNAYHLFVKEGRVDERAELQLVEDGTYAIVDGLADVACSMPPSSVAFVEITADDGRGKP